MVHLQWVKGNISWKSLKKQYLSLITYTDEEKLYLPGCHDGIGSPEDDEGDHMNHRHLQCFHGTLRLHWRESSWWRRDVVVLGSWHHRPLDHQLTVIFNSCCSSRLNVDTFWSPAKYEHFNTWKIFMFLILCFRWKKFYEKNKYKSYVRPLAVTYMSRIE